MPQRVGRTLKVLEASELYLLCVRHEGFTQDVDGTQVSELPVSKQPVNCFDGDPRLNTPKYCKGKHTKARHDEQMHDNRPPCEGPSWDARF